MQIAFNIVVLLSDFQPVPVTPTHPNNAVFIKFTSFALVGALGTIAHYSMLVFLVEFWNFDSVTASGSGALIGLLINYILNYRLTFNSKQTHKKTFPKFAGIAILGLMFNLLIMSALTPKLYYLYAQIVATLCVLLWNFSANSLWTFKADKKAVNGSTPR